MNNDCARNDRNSSIRQPKENGKTLQGVQATPATVNHCDGAGLDDDECKKEPSEEEVIALITRSWSGLLPPPEDFNAYDSDTQKNLIEWNNAQILDESRFIISPFAFFNGFSRLFCHSPLTNRKAFVAVRTIR